MRGLTGRGGGDEEPRRGHRSWRFLRGIRRPTVHGCRVRARAGYVQLGIFDVGRDEGLLEVGEADSPPPPSRSTWVELELGRLRCETALSLFCAAYNFL